MDINELNLTNEQNWTEWIERIEVDLDRMDKSVLKFTKWTEVCIYFSKIKEANRPTTNKLSWKRF